MFQIRSAFSPQDFDHRDSIEVYIFKTPGDDATVQVLDQAGILFLAVVVGGDYNPVSCSITLAWTLFTLIQAGASGLWDEKSPCFVINGSCAFAL